MKAYTDLSQSKKLAKYLPHESADMYYFRQIDNDYIPPDVESIRPIPFFKDGKVNFKYDIPCWSLAALLDVLESEIDGENGETFILNIEKDGTWWDIWYSEKYNEEEPIMATSTEELIDACYEIILELKERNLL